MEAEHNFRGAAGVCQNCGACYSDNPDPVCRPGITRFVLKREPKLVRMIVDRNFWGVSGRLPPGYEAVWHRDGADLGLPIVREITVKGDFPDFIPDMADVRVEVAINSDSSLNWKWIYGEHVYSIRLPELNP